MRIHYRSSTSCPILRGRMPASRALPEPREPPIAGAWNPRRTPSRRGRSKAKQAAEDGRIGDIARSGEKHSMERRTTLADARRPPASARPSAGSPWEGEGAPKRPYRRRLGRKPTAESDQTGASTINQQFPCGRRTTARNAETTKPPGRGGFVAGERGIGRTGECGAVPSS